MNAQLERLEQRIAAAVALIAHLRSEVARLEAAAAAPTPEPAPGPEPVSPGPPEPALEDLRALREEVARLHAERVVVRDRIRGLIREIDAVTW